MVVQEEFRQSPQSAWVILWEPQMKVQRLMWIHAIFAPIEVMNRLLRPTLPTKCIRRWRLDWDTREDCMIMIIVITITIIIILFKTSRDDYHASVVHWGKTDLVLVTLSTPPHCYRSFLLLTYNKIRRPSILFGVPEKNILTDERFLVYILNKKPNIFSLKKKRRKEYYHCISASGSLEVTLSVRNCHS